MLLIKLSMHWTCNIPWKCCLHRQLTRFYSRTKMYKGCTRWKQWFSLCHMLQCHTDICPIISLKWPQSVCTAIGVQKRHWIISPHTSKLSILSQVVSYFHIFIFWPSVLIEPAFKYITNNLHNSCTMTAEDCGFRVWSLDSISAFHLAHSF